MHLRCYFNEDGEATILVCLRKGRRFTVYDILSRSYVASNLFLLDIHVTTKNDPLYLLFCYVEIVAEGF